MSCIKGKNTKPEENVRKFLFRYGFRYRKNDKHLPGKPDIVLPKYKTVIFVNGCFWHAHERCRYFVMPQDNFNFWQQKFAQNKERDRKNIRKLEQAGWNVIIVWECELKKKVFENTMVNLIQSLLSNKVDN